MHFINGFDGVQVVNSRIDSNLVEHRDPSCLGFGFQLSDRRRDVTRGHDVGLAADRRFDPRWMVDEGHEGDDDVMFSNVGVQFRRGNVESNCGRPGMVCGKGLGCAESSTS